MTAGANLFEDENDDEDDYEIHRRRTAKRVSIWPFAHFASAWSG
jgi:hypothetical protein